MYRRLTDLYHKLYKIDSPTLESFENSLTCDHLWQRTMIYHTAAPANISLFVALLCSTRIYRYNTILINDGTQNMAWKASHTFSKRIAALITTPSVHPHRQQWAPMCPRLAKTTFQWLQSISCKTINWFKNADALLWKGADPGVWVHSKALSNWQFLKTSALGDFWVMSASMGARSELVYKSCH